jgi:hypothetical protein
LALEAVLKLFRAEWFRGCHKTCFTCHDLLGLQAHTTWLRPQWTKKLRKINDIVITTANWINDVCTYVPESEIQPSVE